MEILLKKNRLAVLLLLVYTLQAGAQDFSPLQNAFSQSYTYENAGDYGKAINALRTVYDEKSYEVNLRLGWLYYSNGLFTESQAYYQKSIKLRPMAIEARFGYVYPASALGNWEQVKNQYIDILKIAPTNTTANYRLGLIYYGRKEYSLAYKHFEKLANMFPFDYDAVHMLAWTNYHLKKTREAKVLFQKALLIKPGDASCLEGLSLIK